MDELTQTATQDAGAAQGDTGSFPAPDKLFELPEGEFAQHRSEYVKKHGDGSWDNYLNGLAAEPSKTDAPVEKPAADAKTQAVADADGDAEPGEITIDEAGQARDKKTGQFVPKSAFLRVKGEVAEHKGAREQLTTQVIQLKERLALLAEASEVEGGATKAEPEKPIDPKDDLIGAVAQMMKKLDEIQNGPAPEVKEIRARLEAQEMKDYILGDARAFAAKNPDFQGAYTHAVAVQEAAQIALGVDPAEAKAVVQAQLKALIAKAKQDGVSWAERVQKYAETVGYKKANTENEAEKAAQAEIDRINAGKGASQSLRGSGTGGVGETLTRAKVADMGEGEYASTRRSYIAKHGQAAWDRFMNG